jgi:hypothetical protein
MRETCLAHPSVTRDTGRLGDLLLLEANLTEASHSFAPTVCSAHFVG